MRWLTGGEQILAAQNGAGGFQPAQKVLRRPPHDGLPRRTTVALRSVRWLEQHGYVREEAGGQDPSEDAEAGSPWLRCLQGSLGVGELQRWAEHGPSEQSRHRTRGRLLPKPSKGLVAEHLKFNLHAGVSVPAGLPAARERLLRYCARPPLALERLSLLEDGRISYRIKDTDQARVMTPMQFLARLAALVPPPRQPLVRFYGAWAPHSRWRSLVVPMAPEQPPRHHWSRAPAATAEGESDGPCADADGTTSSTTERPNTPCPVLHCVPPDASRGPSAAAATVAPAPPQRSPAAAPHGAAEELRFRRLSRLAWATLYQRIFDIDPLECAGCGGRLRFVEVIEDPVQARSELQRRNLPAKPPPLGRARAPDWVD